MRPSDDRFLKRRLRWVIGFGLVAVVGWPGVPVAAQPGVESSPMAATPADCVIHLSVANPSPGNQEIPRSLVMSGTALDATAASGTGISHIQAFLGNRDQGGLLIGRGSFAPTGAPGSWLLTTSIPEGVIGGQNMFVYGTSSVSGQEAFVEIPVIIGETQSTPTVADAAQTFCPSFMPTTIPTAVLTPQLPAAVPAPPQPAATPAAEPTPQMVAPAAPTPTPAPPPAQPAPALPSVLAPIQVSVSSPPAPPLTFNTNVLFAPAGAQITVTYTNDSDIEHNWRVFDGPDSSAPTLAATQIMTGPGAMASVSFTAPAQAGNYFFWCDVHPTIMTGNLVVQ